MSIKKVMKSVAKSMGEVGQADFYCFQIRKRADRYAVMTTQKVGDKREYSEITVSELKDMVERLSYLIEAVEKQ